MRIAIVEDEAPIARRLARAVQGILGDCIQELTLVSSLEAALEYARTRPLDLVFLDLNLEGRDGFQLLAEAAASRFRTIVVSAYEEQAIRAFEFGVADFLPKPWNEERLRVALERATGTGVPPSVRAARLAVRNGAHVEIIALDHVIAVRGADDYTELHLADGSTRLHTMTLGSLEQVLPQDFMRVHRSWIVNLQQVGSWTPAPGGRATLEIGELRIPVGRTFRHATFQRLR